MNDKLIRVVSFAYELSKLESKLDGAGEASIEHIAKILLFPKDQNVNKWESEIYGFYKNIPTYTVKPHSKPLEKAKVKEFMFASCTTEGSFQYVLDREYADYYNINNARDRDDSNDTLLYQKYINFQDAIVNKIAEAAVYHQDKNKVFEIFSRQVVSQIIKETLLK